MLPRRRIQSSKRLGHMVPSEGGDAMDSQSCRTFQISHGAAPISAPVPAG
ncbi:MAG: hypothetical protein JWM89_167 [Acidimicrobiales bacterium]|nr:hypothetical protein [Acidimicrobiales bacterium]